MKRIALLALLCAPLITSCASAGTGWSPGQFRMTAPLNDNAGTCAVPWLWPVAAAAPRVMHLRITQAPAYAWEDSITTTAGVEVSFSPPYVPLGTPVKARGWASDVGGPSCADSLSRTPVSVTRPPAAPTLIAY
jgi:hypothetical protein